MAPLRSRTVVSAGPDPRPREGPSTRDGDTSGRHAGGQARDPSTEAAATDENTGGAAAGQNEDRTGPPRGPDLTPGLTPRPDPDPTPDPAQTWGRACDRIRPWLVPAVTGIGWRVRRPPSRSHRDLVVRQEPPPTHSPARDDAHRRDTSAPDRWTAHAAVPAGTSARSRRDSSDRGHGHQPPADGTGPTGETLTVTDNRTGSPTTSRSSTARSRPPTSARSGPTTTSPAWRSTTPASSTPPPAAARSPTSTATRASWSTAATRSSSWPRSPTSSRSPTC